MLGFLQDGLQRYLADIGPLGPDKGQGGNSWCAAGFQGSVPEGYFVSHSPTYSVTFAVRGFQVDGKTDQAVALMKQIKIYPLEKASSPPPMEFLNGSRKEIDTLFPDSLRFFELLAMLVDEEPLKSFGPLERSMMQAIGIEKGKPFAPDAPMQALLSEAARLGGAMARANTYDSPTPGIYYYPDRKWQAVPEGMTYKFERDGAPQIDARNNVYHMAAGNSPAMMEKNVGKGSQYLWTYRDAAGEYLDGAKNYRLHVLPGIPAKNFWSVVVYDALSRSELQNEQPLPSVSSYTNLTSTRTAQSIFSLARTSRRRRATGYRPFRAEGGFRSSASTARGAVLRQDLEARGHRSRVVTLVEWADAPRTLRNMPLGSAESWIDSGT